LGERESALSRQFRDAPGRIRTSDPRIRSPRQRFRAVSLEAARSTMDKGVAALRGV
jgi:hypothetical protein